MPLNQACIWRELHVVQVLKILESLELDILGVDVRSCGCLGTVSFCSMYTSDMCLHFIHQFEEISKKIGFQNSGTFLPR